jgi:hypothetical protein
VSNTVFNDAPMCGVRYCITNEIQQNGSVRYLYYMAGSIDTVYTDEIDANHNLISKHKLNDTLIPDLSGIANDPYTGNNIIGDANGLHIYDSNWIYLSTLALPFADSIDMYLGKMRFAFNDSFIAVNCDNGFYSSTPTAHLAIFTRKGTLVSSRVSPVFVAIQLSASNVLYGISTIDYTRLTDSITAPVTFYQMDLFQNIKRKKKFGQHYVMATALTIINDEELIVTGTSVTSSPNNNPKEPDNIYYYKEQLTDIPLQNNANDLCSSYLIYPNPTTNTINLSSSDFNATHDARIEVYNTLGQKIVDSKWQYQTLSLNLANYAAGIYFVRIINNANTCVNKIDKVN